MTAQYAARRPEDLPALAEVAGMSGLDFLQAMFQGRIAGPPIAETLGFWLESVDKGRVVFRGTPGFSALNPMGGVHGGWYGSLLDSCMACAVTTLVPQGFLSTTLEYKVNILRPIPPGTEVRAVGEAQHVGRSTGVARGEVLGAADGRLYATGSTTCLVIAAG